jgi:hypothetical protein
LTLAPNTHATHREGWEADIYIDPEDARRAKLSSDDPQQKAAMKTLRNQICSAFREACIVEYGNVFDERAERFIKWSDLSITKMSDASMAGSR